MEVLSRARKEADVTNLDDVPSRRIAEEFAIRLARKAGLTGLAQAISSHRPDAAATPVPPDPARLADSPPEETVSFRPPSPIVTETLYAPVFHHDGLWTDPAVIHNHDFMRDPDYVKAYEAGTAALGHEHRMYWRLHVALWCANHASKLPGDFAECGVWRGFLTTAILTALDWEPLGKTFYLFDTFDGLRESHLTAGERANRQKLDHLNGYFRDTYGFVSEHFARFPRVKLVRGTVPETLETVPIDRISYLSIDMNCVEPEIAAGNFFWDKLVPGGVILLDDYGFVSYEEQKRGWNAFAAARGTKILALPTGQGLILKN
jgi:hypothetical protein